VGERSVFEAGKKLKGERELKRAEREADGEMNASSPGMPS
jgi:hypothetical protein